MHAGTHLATVQSEMYERRWERFHVKRPARIMAVSPCLTRVSVRNCEIQDISRGGAGLEMSMIHGLSSHYYLEVIGLANRIGCAEIYRNGNRAGVKFIMPIPEDLLRRIVRADFIMDDETVARGKNVPQGLGRDKRR